MQSWFKSINGDPLVNLRCVVAAINPVDIGYNTEELDIAVRDRFDFFLTSEVVADYPYFKAKFGPAVARTVIDLFKEYQSSYRDAQRSKKNTLGYFSPRRLEKVVDAFMQFQTAEIIAASLPDDIIVAHKIWAQRIEEAIIGVKKININPEEAVSNAKELIKLVPSELRKKQNQEPLLKTYSNLKALVAKQNKPAATPSTTGSLVDGVFTPAGEELPESSSIEEKLLYKLRTATAAALNAGINTNRIFEDYGPIARDFDSNQKKTITRNWQYSKVNNYEQALNEYLRTNPEATVAEVEITSDTDAKADPTVDQAIQAASVVAVQNLIQGLTAGVSSTQVITQP